MRRSLIGISLLVPTLGLVAMCWAWWKRTVLFNPSTSRSEASSHRRREGGDGCLQEAPRLRQIVEEEITVPGNIVGYIIGRRGTRVREIEEDSGARLRFKELQGTEDKVCT